MGSAPSRAPSAPPAPAAVPLSSALDGLPASVASSIAQETERRLAAEQQARKRQVEAAAQRPRAPPPPPGVQTFDVVTDEEGNALTSYVDDQTGVRYCMDWDSLQWKRYEESPKQRVVEAVEPASAAADCLVHVPANGWVDVLGSIHGGARQRVEGDQHGVGAATRLGDRAGTFQHPGRGVVSTFVFEGKRNLRHFFNEASGAWQVMPTALEAQVLQRELAQLSAVLPDWSSGTEMVLALRQNNYSAEATIAWYLEEQAEVAGAQAGRSRRGGANGANGAAGAVALRQQVEGLEHVVGQMQGALHDKDEEILRLKTQVMAMKSGFTRQHTVLDTRVADLDGQLAAARAEIEALEHALVAHEDALTASVLETSEQTELAHQLSLGLRAQGGSGDVARAATLTRSSTRAGPWMASRQGGAQLAQVVSGLRRVEEDRQALLHLFETERAALHQIIAETNVAAGALDAHYRAVEAQMQTIRAKCRAEMLQRKLLFNQVQELRGNVRVFCRVRNDGRVARSALAFPSETELAIQPQTRGEPRAFEYDRVFPPTATQEEVFEDTRPLVTSVMDGYNVCILAYGQTGSGKTYTMMGPPEAPGVNTRTINELLALCHAQTDVHVSLAVSMVEIYNEIVIDLLAAPGPDGPKTCQILSKAKGVHNIADGTELEVATADDVFAVIQAGSQNRKIASTKMNSQSSRSHLAVIIYVKSFNTISKIHTESKLTLLDLAGSERVAKTEAKGARLVEAAAINKSLSALGQVFGALRTHALHIPFRNSKLTHLLQDSLSGDAKAMVFLHVSPLPDNEQETVSTLTFGKAIRQIELNGGQPVRKGRVGRTGPRAR